MTKGERIAFEVLADYAGPNEAIADADPGEALWGRLDPPERDALVVLVARALTELARHTPTWLPGEADLTRRGKVRVTVEFEMAQLDALTAFAAANPDALRRRQVADLLRILECSES